MRRKLLLVVALVGLLLPTVALADWHDAFDNYQTNFALTPQSSWELWDQNSADAMVRSGTVQSPPNAVQIGSDTDVVRMYSGYETYRWVYYASIYVQSTTLFKNEPYFILLNQFHQTHGQNNWSVQVGFDQNSGLTDAACGSGTNIQVPYPYDTWITITVEIYLDEDWTKVFLTDWIYGTRELYDPNLPPHATLGTGYSWTKGVFGGDTDGILNIACVDLYGTTNTMGVFFDDCHLIPYHVHLRRGNVNTKVDSSGAYWGPEDVLMLNNSIGDPIYRVYDAPIGQSILLEMNAPSVGPLPTNFTTYLFLANPGIGDWAPQPMGIGDSSIPMPLSNGNNKPPPYTLANNIGFRPYLGVPLLPIPPANPKSTILSLPSGLPPGFYAFQGYTFDAGSNGPLSLTNCIVLRVQ